MNDQELTDEEREQYAQEFEELDAKVILTQILAEQQRTNMLLEEVASDDTVGDSGGSSMFECDLCGVTVAGDEREGHAVGEHKAPEGIVEQFFEEV